MIFQRETNTGENNNRAGIAKIYLLNLLLHFVDSGFWLIAILGTLMKVDSISQSGYLFGLFLLFESTFNVLSSCIDHIISRKKQTIIGMACFSLGSVIFANYSNSDILILSYLFFGLGIAAMNGSAQAWFIDIKESTQVRISNKLFHGRLNYCRRFGQLMSLPLGAMLAFGSDIPWYTMVAASILFIFIASNIPVNTFNSKKIYDFSAYGKWYLLPLALSQPLYGIEFGIRNLLINPFVLHELNGGNHFLFSTKVISQVLAGFLGNYFYNNWICTLDDKKNEYFLVVSLLIYALFEYVTSLTTSYSIWLIFQTLAIFSMGWYFPMLESTITNNLPARWLGIGHSLKTALYTSTGGVFLLLYSNEMSMDNIRFWFQIAALTLVVSAVTIYVGSLFKQKDTCNLLEQKREIT